MIEVMNYLDYISSYCPKLFILKIYKIIYNSIVTVERLNATGPHAA
jgi:hypothetical protein